MKIEQTQVTVRELCEGYVDDGENGVVGYGGRLNIRPPYQREFIYGEHQQEAVINTILRGFPLNTMYWSRKDDGNYEIIDGQQRTMSICRYVKGDFSYQFKYFHNQPQDIQQTILDYELTVYVCEGTDSERLDWFRVINIAGEKLTEQELRNATYAGTWLTDAKRYFSKSGCAASRLSRDYISANPIRQELLERTLRWKSGGNIEHYMAQHQHDANATELWLYFQAMMAWVKATFPHKHKNLWTSVDWGQLYNEFGSKTYDAEALEQRIRALLLDDDVTRKSGIYPYLLDGKESHLSLRAFSEAQVLAAYEQQGGICPRCGKHFELEQMQADHITPWSKGGKTVPDNCQMLCAECNRRKGGK